MERLMTGNEALEQLAALGFRVAHQRRWLRSQGDSPVLVREAQHDRDRRLLLVTVTAGRDVCLVSRAQDGDEERLWTRLVVNGQCFEWTGGTNNKGYGLIRWYDEQRGFEYTHRLAWRLTMGPIPEGLYVCHHCDNRRCCRPSHLFVGTALDNVRDAMAKGRVGRRRR